MQFFIDFSAMWPCVSSGRDPARALDSQTFPFQLLPGSFPASRGDTRKC